MKAGCSFLVACALLACGGSQRAAAPASTAADSAGASADDGCAAAARALTPHALTMLRDDPNAKPDLEATLEGDAATACERDGWPAESIACFRAAASPDDLHRCASELSEPQWRALAELVWIDRDPMGPGATERPPAPRGAPDPLSADPDDGGE
ncbi:MAG: hypothetical protein R2939_14520 [Kofleriaceae bacterium]